MNRVTQQAILVLSDLEANASHVIPHADNTGLAAHPITKEVSTAYKKLSATVSQLKIQQFSVYLSHESPERYTDSDSIDKEYTDQLAQNIYTTIRTSRDMLSILTSTQESSEPVAHLEQSIRDAEFLAQSLLFGLLVIHYVPVQAMSEA